MCMLRIRYIFFFFLTISYHRCAISILSFRYQMQTNLEEKKDKFDVDFSLPSCSVDDCPLILSEEFDQGLILGYRFILKKW